MFIQISFWDIAVNNTSSRRALPTKNTPLNTVIAGIAFLSNKFHWFICVELINFLAANQNLAYTRLNTTPAWLLQRFSLDLFMMNYILYV